MADYDYSCLSSFEFENLIKDLYQAETGLILESFKQGRDGGIDLRCLKNNKTIIQCKNFAKSPYSTLFSHLKNKEQPKLSALNPDQYIITTSVGLTPQNKTQIKELFTPFCLTETDIWGKDDINTRLGLHDQIVKKNYKLWFISTVVLEELLEKVVNHDLYTKTKIDFENFLYNFPKIVVTESFEKVNEIINDHNICVLFGLPGSGKTTLMKYVVMKFSHHKYEPVFITQNISEALRLYKEDRHQIFYFDDFLGKCFLKGEFQKNEDEQLISFIEKIKRSSNKKFILSTREYIFKQASCKSEIIKDIELYKFAIELPSLTKSEKAKILYNHLWHSEIDYDKIEELLLDKDYIKIFEHSNFNPRLIESMIKISGNTDHFLKSFLYALDHPDDLWKHPFENDICRESRILLYILGSFTYGISYSRLLKSFSYFFDEEITSSIKNRENFEFCLKELDGTFISSKRFSSGSDLQIEFNNPSIHDFIYSILLKDINTTSEIVRKSISSTQLNNLFEFIQQNCEKEELPNRIIIGELLNRLEFLILYNKTEFVNDIFVEWKIRNYLEVFLLSEESNDNKKFINIIKKTILLPEYLKIAHLQHFLYLITLINQNANLFEEIIPSLHEVAKKFLLSYEWSDISEYHDLCKYIEIGVKFEEDELSKIKINFHKIISNNIDYNNDGILTIYDPVDDLFVESDEGIYELEQLTEQIKIVGQYLNINTSEILSSLNLKIKSYYDSYEPETEEDNIPIEYRNDDGSDEIERMFDSLADRNID
jgi:hypothetical protein